MDSKSMVGHDAPREERQLEALSQLPPELEKAMSKLDDMFRVTKEKLQQITKRFQEELEEGLKADGNNIPMNITWTIGMPSGNEKGRFLTVDLGGTNLRVCHVTLQGQGKHEMEQNSYKLPDELKHGDAEPLWSFVAESLEEFLKEHGLANEKEIPFAFTFSYPVTQHYIDHGILQRWTKGFDINGVEGKDAAEQLRQAMQKSHLPLRLIALVNDTVGALISSAYTDPLVAIGGIFGTGCNAAYMESCGSIPKLSLSSHPGLKPSTPMAINCEYGAFFGEVQGQGGESESVLPRTKYDILIDEASPRPGQQTFEKLSAGLYLGEIFRVVLLDLHEQGLIFQQQDVSKLREPYVMDTSFLSFIEDDESRKLSRTADKWRDEFGIHVSEPELELQRRLAELVATRAARLCTCGVAAICRKKGIERAHVAADGSVANKHPKFKARWAEALGQILEWEGRKEDGEDPICLVSAEDGSGVGAAIIAAMTMERAERGEKEGIRGE